MQILQKNQITNYLFLHFCILLYTGTTLLSKVASNYDFLSICYICIFGLMFLNMGLYAFLWQKAIKNFQPSVAYSNKSVTVIWTLLFSAVLFSEHITLNNIIGAIIIVIGIVLVVSNNE